MKPTDPTQFPAQENIKVANLIPGDVVSLPFSDLRAVFVSQCEHPLHPLLRMVIWREGDPYSAKGKWFHDALSPDQVVGTTWATTEEKRTKALRWALLYS